MKKWIILVGMLSISGWGFAANLPSQVQGAQSMSKEECIKNNTNDCIQSICMTSSERDCQERCAKGARDKCNVMSQ